MVFQKKDKKWFLEARKWILGQNCNTRRHDNVAAVQLEPFGTGESKKKNQDSPSSEAGLCFYMLHNWKTE